MSTTEYKLSVLLTIEDEGIFQFGALTSKEALKKSRKTKQPTPNHLQTIYTLRQCLVTTGRKYRSIVNDYRLMEGKSATFVPQATYCEPVGDNGLVYKHKDRSQFYLRVYPGLCKQYNEVLAYYDALGRRLTVEQYKDIQAEYLALSAALTKSQGLEDAVLVNNYKLENVYLVKRGAEGYDVTPPAIIEMLSQLTQGSP
jgi:hypothetical protein